MTDWWAKGNDREGEEATARTSPHQVRAQNDLNMVNADAASNSQHDNLDDALADGRLTRDALRALCDEYLPHRDELACDGAQPRPHER